MQNRWIQRMHVLAARQDGFKNAMVHTARFGYAVQQDAIQNALM